MPYGDDIVELRSDVAGVRFIAVRGGRMIIHQPEIANVESSESCRELRQLRSQVEALQRI
jgi:hypothetical protein